LAKEVTGQTDRIGPITEHGSSANLDALFSLRDPGRLFLFCCCHCQSTINMTMYDPDFVSLLKSWVMMITMIR